MRPFSINPVQCYRLYSKYVGIQGCFRPCGIDFTGGNIFNIIFVFNIIIPGTAVGRRPVMDYYIFGGWCLL